ncbi:MAG: hypothetical protein C0467_31330 [Planctomycetaceae bacterium]|nr:hypothetical protein [Planctomycetaceae bacterium]
MTATETEAGQEEKVPEKYKSIPEKVTIRRYFPKEMKFLPKPIENVQSKKLEKDGVTRFNIDGALVGGVPAVGSEIIEKDKDGKETVWVVTKAGTNMNGPHSCVVSKKEDPKKD